MGKYKRDDVKSPHPHDTVPTVLTLMHAIAAAALPTIRVAANLALTRTGPAEEIHTYCSTVASCEP